MVKMTTMAAQLMLNSVTSMASFKVWVPTSIGDHADPLLFGSHNSACHCHKRLLTGNPGCILCSLDNGDSKPLCIASGANARPGLGASPHLPFAMMRDAQRGRTARQAVGIRYEYAVPSEQNNTHRHHR